MENLAIFLVLAGAIFAIFSHIKVVGEAMPDSFDNLYKKHGERQGLDWRLLKAIATVESGEESEAVNPSDPSYGLMQILCRADCPTCPCTNRLNVLGWEQATPERLKDPDFNVMIASQILKWNIDTFGDIKGISVYNNWSARFDEPEGPFRNQDYVEKVLAAFRGFKTDDTTRTA